MENAWFIRATTKDGKKFITKLFKTKAILIFKQLYEAAKNSVEAVRTGLSETWEKEIFMEFMNPDGIIVLFEVYDQFPNGKICVFNMFWFDVDNEGRRQLKSQHPVGIEYTFYGVIPNPFNPDEFVPQYYPPIWQSHDDEMSADWHMGHYAKVEEHEAVHAQVLKDRASGDREIIDIKLWDLPTSIPEEVIPLIIEKATGVDLAPKAKPNIIVKGSTHNHDDWYSEPAMDKTKYRIYINGSPSNMIVDNIDFMNQIHENSKKGIFSVADLTSYFSMTGPLVDTLERFLRLRDFKIGAHPADYPLEDGNDATYSIFWGQVDEVVYVSPLGFGGY